MLTIFLAESNPILLGQSNNLILARFFDILIGSIIGAIGGWALYHERIHFFTKKQMLKTRVILRKYRNL